ncbi:MAG TPA: site-2 protease family protein [Solirubrobacteraceae bacterium]|nr:site-2 protease family protein [Solirubrobacteraceae bacterium]
MEPPRPTLPEPPRDASEPRPAEFGPPPPPLDPEEDERRASFFRRRIAPLGAALIALLTKLKTVLLFLGQFKLLVTAGSMAVSLVAYASIWGWTFALGFVVLLLVHELGHVIALRREGIPASAPMFIPFLGAVVSARSLGDDALAEARVGLAGPVLGSIGAGACLLAWRLTGHDYWRALGFTGLFLNLFNLLPVVPLDGGRAMAAMSPWMWCVGFAATVALAVAFPNPVIIIIAIVAALETWRRLRARRSGDPDAAAYYRVSPRGRALVALTYLGLVALLVLGMHATHLHRTL